MGGMFRFPRRQRFKFSLRTLFVVVTLLTAICGYLGWQAHIVRHRQYLLERFVRPRNRLASIEINPFTWREVPDSWIRTAMGDYAVSSWYVDRSISDSDFEAIKDVFPEAIVRRIVFSPDAPMVFERRDGDTVAVEESDMFPFEQKERRRLAEGEALDEVFLLASSSSSDFLADPARLSDPRELIVVAIKGETGTLRSALDFGKQRLEQRLSAEKVRAIRQFFKTSGADSLPRLESKRTIHGREQVIVHGTIYVYLHLTPQAGARVWINNPPTKDDKDYPPDDPLRKYSSLVKFISYLGKVVN